MLAYSEGITGNFILPLCDIKRRGFRYSMHETLTKSWIKVSKTRSRGPVALGTELRGRNGGDMPTSSLTHAEEIRTANLATATTTRSASLLAHWLLGAKSHDRSANELCLKARAWSRLNMPIEGRCPNVWPLHAQNKVTTGPTAAWPITTRIPAPAIPKLK